MGDPKKIRKKYETPEHPWNKERIELEKSLSQEHGLKNKKEIWKMDSKITKFKDQVKNLATRTDEQGNKERMQLMSKLVRLGLLKEAEPLDGVLSLEVNDIMNRRLQTIMLRKNLVRTVKQARQFIVHGHVMVNGKKITSPGYMVSFAEEPTIEFAATSTLYDKDHPERIVEKPKRQEKGEKKEEDTKEKIMTEEELEAKEITKELTEEEKKALEKVEKETPAEEVEEIIEKNEENKQTK